MDAETATLKPGTYSIPTEKGQYRLTLAMTEPSMDLPKDEWIAQKTKYLIEMEQKEADQARAMAESMYEQMMKEHEMMAKKEKEKAMYALEKALQMPILPTKATKTVDGRDVPEEVIKAALAYDKNIRPAIVKLDTTDAHGDSNGPALGRVERVYTNGDYIYAEVIPQKGAELTLPQMCALDGPFPSRSIEMDMLQLAGNSKKQLWLEAIALCGAHKSALNLPPVQFASDKSTKATYTVALIGDETMPETETDPKPKPDQGIDLAKVKSEMEANFAKQKQELESDFAKKLADEAAARLAIERDRDKEKLLAYFASEKMRPKVRQDEREDLVTLLLSLKGSETKITFAKKEVSQYDAVLASLEARVDVHPTTKEAGAGLPNDMKEEGADNKYQEIKLAVQKEKPDLDERAVTREAQARFAKLQRQGGGK